MLIDQIRKIVKDNTWFFISGLVSLFVAVLFISIASRRLTNANFGSDGGDFLAAILTKGVPHPTGYPTYILLGILFQYLPFSTPVFRGALESIIPAALAAGFLTGWVGYVTKSRSSNYLWSAVVTGISWAVAPLFFSQAVIVEVHGLQSLFVVLFLWWITLNLEAIHLLNTKRILVLSFFVGLGFGNHVMIVLFTPLMIVVWFILLRQTKSVKLPLLQLLFILLGFLVYLYLPLRAKSYPPINWGNPQSLSGFLWEITGTPYRSLLFGVKSAALWDRIRSVSSLLMDQFGALGLAAGVVGAVHYSFRIKWFRWILVWVFLVYIVFSIGYNTNDSVGYLIPAIMVYGIWIGLAVPALQSIKWRQIPIGTILIGILIISIGVRIPGTRARLDPRNHDQPARYAEQLLIEAPPNAIINTTTDQDTFPLWFYHFGLKERPDLRIVVLPLTQFVWYQETLVHNYSDLEFPPVYSKDLPNDDWGKEINRLNADRAVCITHLSAETETGIAFECNKP